jgi:hypothetical protein
MELELTAQEEADAARAASISHEEIVNSEEEDPSEVDDLVDYNEDDDLETAIKANQAEVNKFERESLKEMLTYNGYALRECNVY